MALKDNQVVTIIFTLKDEDGIIIEETTKENPFSFISGYQQILPRLEAHIGEMLIGSKKTFVLAPEDAYGEYDDGAIQKVKRSEFPAETELEVGMGFIADSPDGNQMPFIIENIQGDDVTLNFNHPLAGKTLTFEVELMGLRDATLEELSHGHVHGTDGHHH
jgi:FKBP-type peptidyl-prolyl cis-trans isomerase SlyD